MGRNENTIGKSNLSVVVSSIFVFCFLSVLVCNPHIVSGAESFKDGVLVTESKFYLQQGRSQRISCTSLADISDAVVIFWYKVFEDEAFEPILLIRFTLDVPGGNHSAGPRYQLAPDASLVIKSVVDGDAGRYRCLKVATTQSDNMENVVEVVVLDDEFPADRGVVREGRNITITGSQQDIEVQCPIEELPTLHQPTVYWSKNKSGLDKPTEIIATVLSDGETHPAPGYRVTSSSTLVLKGPDSGNSLDFWCHVSSMRDKETLQSARIFVSIKGENRLGLIIGVLFAVVLVLLIIVFLLYWKRDRIKRRFFKERIDGPAIKSDFGMEWVLDSYLGPKGKFGGKFSSLKSVTGYFNDSGLAVLDDQGLYIFSQKLHRLHHVTELKATLNKYVAMVAHPDGCHLLLGAQNGDVTSVSFNPYSERLVCSLSGRQPDTDNETEGVGLTQELKGTGQVHNARSAVRSIFGRKPQISYQRTSDSAPDEGPSTEPQYEEPLIDSLPEIKPDTDNETEGLGSTQEIKGSGPFPNLRKTVRSIFEKKPEISNPTTSDSAPDEGPSTEPQYEEPLVDSLPEKQPDTDNETEGLGSTQEIKVSGPFPNLRNKVRSIFKKKPEISNPTTSDSAPDEGPSTSESIPLTSTSHELTGLAVDANGDVYVGDNGNNSIAVFDQKGDRKTSIKLKFSPKILTGSSVGEVFVHNRESSSPIKRISVNAEEPETVFAPANATILNPVNILADSTSVFIVSDTKCNGQMEILQFHTKGNFIRQFAKPWKGVRGLCLFASGERLALYDNSIIRIYTKQPANVETPVATAPSSSVMAKVV